MLPQVYNSDRMCPVFVHLPSHVFVTSNWASGRYVFIPSAGDLRSPAFAAAGFLGPSTIRRLSPHICFRHWRSSKINAYFLGGGETPIVMFQYPFNAMSPIYRNKTNLEPFPFRFNGLFDPGLGLGKPD